MNVDVPTLETERLILRAWTPADAAPFAEMCGDAELMRYVGGQMDQINAWRRMAVYAGCWALRGYGPFALQHKINGDLAGYSGIYDPDGWPEREINWGLRRKYLGQGLVTEAARCVRDYAYDVLKFQTITSCIDLENAPSIGVATRLGAKLDRKIEFFGRPGGVFRHVAPNARTTTETPR